MVLKEIRKGLFLVSYPTCKQLSRAFIRFQEHYESPNKKFRTGSFSLAEFKRWYRTTRKNGKFTYYTDWGGFNIPGTILAPFYDGQFRLLSLDEKKILKVFKWKKLSEVYIIGVYGKKQEALLHETAHGLFYLDKSYRRKVLGLLKKNEKHLVGLKKVLLKAGYADNTLLDECHAYILCEFKYLLDNNLETKPIYQMRIQLRKHFSLHSRVI